MILSVFVTACNDKQNLLVYDSLRAIDNIIEPNPETAQDSLFLINLAELNPANKAYYHLLSTIVAAKLYRPFENDLVISEVADYYSKQPLSANYIRALLYLGLVRSEIGISDTIVYHTLKRAEDIILTHPGISDPVTNDKIYFHLGYINERAENFNKADYYYKKAQEQTLLSGDVNGLVASSISLFWIYSQKKDKEAALMELNKVDTLLNLSPEQYYDIIGAKGEYYFMSGKYNDALFCFKELERRANQIKGEIWFSAIYEAISDIYTKMGVLDSALYYAQESVNHLTDTMYYRQNYIIYNKLSSIAARQGNYELAVNNYESAFLLLLNSIEKEHRAGSNIYRIDNDYALMRVELEKEKHKKRSQLFLLIGIILFLAFISIVIVFRIIYIKTENLGLRAKFAEEEALNIEMKEQHKEHLLAVYRIMAQNNKQTKDFLIQLTQKYFREEPKIIKEIDRWLISMKYGLPNALADSIDEKWLLPGINVDLLHLTKTERVIIFSLSHGLSNKDTATLLGITENNLGSKKYNLKKKVVVCMPENSSLISIF